MSMEGVGELLEMGCISMLVEAVVGKEEVGVIAELLLVADEGNTVEAVVVGGSVMVVVVEEGNRVETAVVGGSVMVVVGGSGSSSA